MAITPSALYTAQAIALGSGTQNNPGKLDVSALDSNGLAFNFVLTSGSTSVGPNPILVFRYAFSINSYTAGNAAAIIGNSSNMFRLRLPTAVSTTWDITTQFITPVLGNYLYYWYDQQAILATGATLTASALPLTVTSYIANT